MDRTVHFQDRQADWQRLEELCHRAESVWIGRLRGIDVTEFAALYRAACADLALSAEWGWPPQVVDYLHRLVARAHNVFYRSRGFQIARWWNVIAVTTPQTIYRDPFVYAAAMLFWIPFVLAAWLAGPASPYRDFAEGVLGSQQLEELETQFAEQMSGRAQEINFFMAGFYIRHNINIGLSCFAGGLLIVPGVILTIYNAVVIGAAFGHMARPEVVGGDNFYQFVTAHGPCELTAVVLMAAAGLQLGTGWLAPGRFSRLASVRRAGGRAVPIVAVAMMLFIVAAVIEAFVSPSLAAYPLKAVVAALSSVLIMTYFVLLGMRRNRPHAT